MYNMRPGYFPECDICTRPKIIKKLYTVKLIIKNKEPVYRLIAIETASIRKLFHAFDSVRVNHTKSFFPELEAKENDKKQTTLRAMYPLLSIEVEQEYIDEFIQELKKKGYAWAKIHALMKEAEIAEKYYSCLAYCPTKWAYEEPWPKPGERVS